MFISSVSLRADSYLIFKTRVELVLGTGNDHTILNGYTNGYTIVFAVPLGPGDRLEIVT